jgi:hypothetical protein
MNKARMTLLLCTLTAAASSFFSGAGAVLSAKYPHLFFSVGDSAFDGH